MDKLTQVTKEGFTFMLRKEKDCGALTEVFDDKEYSYPELSIKDYYTVIDIGAHIGTFTISAARQAKRVFAYEPDYDNFRLLEKNIKLNNIDNVMAFNCAVSNKKGRRKLFLHEKFAVLYSFYGKSKHFVCVDTVSLKDIFDENNINFCHLLKIDAEGAEYEIFKNTPQSYFDKIDNIVIEWHEGPGPRKLTGLVMDLTRAGFVIKDISERRHAMSRQDGLWGGLFAKKTKKRVFFRNYSKLFIGLPLAQFRKHYIAPLYRLCRKFLDKVGSAIKKC